MMDLTAFFASAKFRMRGAWLCDIFTSPFTAAEDPSHPEFRTGGARHWRHYVISSNQFLWSIVLDGETDEDRRVDDRNYGRQPGDRARPQSRGMAVASRCVAACMFLTILSLLVETGEVNALGGAYRPVLLVPRRFLKRDYEKRASRRVTRKNWAEDRKRIAALFLREEEISVLFRMIYNLQIYYQISEQKV